MSARLATRNMAVALLLGVLAPLVLLPLFRSPLVQGVELKTLDARMRWRGAAGAAPEVAVVAIDERSVDALGQWPWPRAVLADLVQRLHAAGAKVIALDITFSEPERGGGAGDEALASAIRDTPGVVLGYFFRGSPPQARVGGGPAVAEGDPSNIETSRIELAVMPPGGFPAVPEWPGVETNIDLLARATPHAGHFLVVPDRDGTVRRYSLVARHGGQFYPSLALRASSVFLGGAPVSLRPYEGHLPLIRLGEREIPASERGELLVNFRGPFLRTFPYVPAVDVLDGRLPPGLLRDKLVFVGATETGIADLRTTPFDLASPGVEVHATVADNLIHSRFIRSTAVQTIQGILAMLLLGPVAALIAAAARRPAAGAGGAVLLLAGHAAVAQQAFSRWNVHLPLVLPLAAGALAYAAATVHRNVFVEAKARQIRKTFQQFVSGAIVEEMLRDPDKVRLGGERRVMTVLFSDIRGFTSMSEKLDPEQVVQLLNEYLTPMTRTVIECGGTLDKYMGDAIMALFGAPVEQADHATRACAAALAMRAGLARLNDGWSGRGLPRIAVGIGINTGVMSVGNMGSEMIFDYTVIGDAANLGSRLEGLNKVYGTDAIVSEFTAVQAADGFVLRELDRVRVKGKSEPVTVLELVGRAGDLGAWWATGVSGKIGALAPSGIAEDEARRFLAAWREGLSLFREREFAAAAGRFQECLAARASDGPCRLYVDRCRALLASPPPTDWDPAVTMETK